MFIFLDSIIIYIFELGICIFCVILVKWCCVRRKICEINILNVGIVIIVMVFNNYIINIIIYFWLMKI